MRPPYVGIIIKILLNLLKLLILLILLHFYLGTRQYILKIYKYIATIHTHTHTHNAAGFFSMYMNTAVAATNICNNCGKVGHQFQQCKSPINSYGIIAFTQGARFLMIRRKDSFGFISFVRGKYSPYNMVQLRRMFDEMSVAEKAELAKYNDELIRRGLIAVGTGGGEYSRTHYSQLYERKQIQDQHFNNLWRKMWGIQEHDDDKQAYKIERQYKIEKENSIKKYETLCNGIYVDGQYITLISLLNASPTQWPETEWEFPKGRRNFPKERDIDCALREFEEETGIRRGALHVVENLTAYDETFIGTNQKSYKHKYFLAYIDPADINTNAYQKNEVSKIACNTLDECLACIRPYHLEKKQMIQNIHAAIMQHDFFVEL